jgi:oligosaccharide 4-alpha-D-glucosyltransferase
LPSPVVFFTLMPQFNTMIAPKKCIASAVFLLLLLSVQGQKVLVSSVGKDPFNDKAAEVVYKSKEGEWTFQSYTNTIIKTTFRPADYTNGEQVSDAVINKPPVLKTKITAATSQTIEWENLASVVIQREKLYYKMGREVKVKSASYFVQDQYRGFRFQLSDEEQFFGGGERALPGNRRGYRFNLYNNPTYGYGLGADNLNFSVPVIISSAGYAIFFDNPSKGYLDIGLTDKSTLEAGFVSGELTYYIVFGKNLDEILKNYTSLTGRQPLPPRWVLGNFLSRFGYRSEEQVKQVVDRMKQDHFPMDGLIFDLFWFGDNIKGTLGNLDWVNTQKWPNPKLMIDNFRTFNNLKSVLVTEPFILQDTKTYTESQPFLATDASGKPYILNDFYFGKGGMVDVFRKQSQDWIWKYYKKQIGNGVAGWWVDLGEPEKHPNEIMHNFKDYGVNRLLSADEVHNVYGHYWSKFLFEKYASDYPGVRLFNLNRSGFAGSQRYSVFPWTGDVGRNWSGLKAQPLVLLGMSVSGMPYVHSDAGGFSMVDQADAELYTRWLQMAAFTPIFRPHGTALEDYDKTIKSIPSEPAFWDAPAKNIVRKYINLRYELLPYNYTLGYEQAVNGKPLMRPLWYYNFTDSNALKTDDEYYWGDNILVAPVTSQGATARFLYLPAGKWYSLTDNAVTDGGKWMNQKVDIENIPVFVKEGSFLPLWISKDTIKSTEQYDTKEMTVRYYPSKQSSSYVWFDDDGITNKTLEKADYELVTFKGITAGDVVTIDITTNNPSNYGRRSKRKFLIEVPATSVEAGANGKLLPAANTGKRRDPFQQVEYSYVTVEFDGKPLKVEIKMK